MLLSVIARKVLYTPYYSRHLKKVSLIPIPWRIALSRHAPAPQMQNRLVGVEVRPVSADGVAVAYRAAAPVVLALPS